MGNGWKWTEDTISMLNATCPPLVDLGAHVSAESRSFRWTLTLSSLCLCQIPPFCPPFFSSAVSLNFKIKYCKRVRLGRGEGGFFRGGASLCFCRHRFLSSQFTFQRFGPCCDLYQRPHHQIFTRIHPVSQMWSLQPMST